MEELIRNTHPVRIVNDVINEIHLDPLNAAYKTRGSCSYHPQMLLKVFVYGYVSNVYSSRKLEGEHLFHLARPLELNAKV